MSPRIEISDTDRAEIIAFMREFHRKAEASLTVDQSAQAEISKYEDVAASLRREIAEIQPRVAESEEAASRLQVVQSRLSAVEQKGNELRHFGKNGVTLTMDEAWPLILKVGTFYECAVREAILEAVKPFHNPSDLQSHLIFAALHAHKAAEHFLRSWGEASGVPATPQNVNNLFTVFRRVLKGEPHLGFDTLPDDVTNPTA